MMPNMGYGQMANMMGMQQQFAQQVAAQQQGYYDNYQQQQPQQQQAYQQQAQQQQPQMQQQQQYDANGSMGYYQQSAAPAAVEQTPNNYPTRNSAGGFSASNQSRSTRSSEGNRRGGRSNSRQRRHRSRSRSRSRRRDTAGNNNRYGGGHDDRRGGFSSRGGAGGFSEGAGSDLKNINWSTTQLVPFQKNFYQEHPAVAGMSSSEVDQWRQLKSISIVAGVAPNPIRTFEEANFPEYVMDSIRQAGFQEPSPIQSQGWPVALSGRDMIGIAETGSGKTLSFLLPALVHINAQQKLNRGDGPICLVLAPTRELVQQIEKECVKFASHGNARSTSLVGGMPKGPQIRDMNSGREIVVATPGRLLDLMNMGIFDLKRVTFLCLDEADRMLDMGFERDLRKICGQVRSDRQTLLWSATWPKEVQALARDLCKEAPVQINIGEMGLKANQRITQHVEVLSTHQKMDRLQQVLSQMVDERGQTLKTIVFSKTKRGCDDLARGLRRYGGIAIHGDKSQQDRDWALNQFRSGRNPVLVATDVAARGLDVKDCMCVVNYDFPLNIEDYVHRIGRTGRAGAYGTAYSFFCTADLPSAGKSAKDLCKILRDANQNVPQELMTIAQSHFDSKGSGKRSYGKGKGKGKGYGGGFGRY